MTSQPGPARPVLVTGGTGTLGSHLVPLLRSAGREVRVLSRHAAAPAPDRDLPAVSYVAADLADPDDRAAVARAARGVDVVIHAAGSSKGDDLKTRTLVDAILESGARPHVVYISVVGADRTPVVSGVDRALFGYVEAKRVSEEIIVRSGLPWTILRATQFHELVLLTARQLSRMPIVPVPSRTRMQPIAAREVAARLVELALAPAQGLAPDLAGPAVHGMDDLVRSYLRAVGRRRPILRMRMPGRAAAAFRDGANLSPERAVGRVTWAEFLADRTAAEGDRLPAAGRPR